MRGDTLLRAIAKGAATAFLARIVFAGASFAVTSLTALAYGAPTLGAVAALTTLMTLGGIVAALGTSGSVSYHVAAQLHTGSVPAARRSYRRIVAICLGGSLAVGLGLAALSGPVGRGLFGGAGIAAPGLLLAIAIACVPLRLFAELTGTVMRALDDIPAFAVLITLPALLNLALLGGAVLAGAGPMAAVWALMGGLGLSALAGFVWIGRRWRGLADGRPGTPGPGTGEILRHSLPMLVSTLGAYVVTGVGLLVIPALAGAAATGQFAVALRLATTASLVLMSINAITTPVFARLHAAGDRDEMVRTARRTARLMVWAVLPLMAGLVLFGRPLIHHAFGPEFAPAYVPMAIMLAGQLVNTVTGPSDFLMNMAGMQTALRNIIVPVAVFAVVSSLMLVPVLGITGAALSYAVSLTLWNLAGAVYLRRRFGVWIAWLPGLTRGD